MFNMSEEDCLAGPQIISYPEALQILESQARTSLLASEMISLDQSLGRIAAEDILSREVLPTFANSAMDGFAVRASETVNASSEKPLRLPILGNLAAGDSPAVSPKLVGSWEIMTGAPFPESFDACIRIEDIEIISDTHGLPTHIQITKPAEKFQNRREVGEDFQVNGVLVKKGSRLRAEDILCLASVGILQVKVLRLLKVGIISTGKELVPLTEIPVPGKIRNSSAPFLEAAMKARHCEVAHLGTIPDDASAFKALIESLKPDQFDLILTTGAISMGKYDFVVGALKDLDTDFYFKKVAMRPGKPIIFGKLKVGSFIIGLPGNPISGAVGLRFFVDPFLRTIQGVAPELPLRLTLSKKTFKTPGATCFFKGHLDNIEGRSVVVLHSQQRPSLMHPLLTSNVWVALPEKGEEISEGALVDVYPFLKVD